MKRLGVAALLVIGLTAAGCTPVITAGTDGVFTFNGQRVFYSAPAQWTRILIVMHGQSRNAEGYRDSWTTADALVLVPEFTDADYPAYPDAGMDKIEPLFDHVRGSITSYSLYGFSAGAQFTHRFLLTTPNRADQSVAASAGWWTVPEAQPWPYGWTGHEDPAWLNEPMTIMVGLLDNDPNDSDLRHTTGADRQGLNRLERARYMHARTIFPYQEVPGVGHSNAAMFPAARAVLGL